MYTRRRHGSRNTEQGVYLGPSQTQVLPPLVAPVTTATAPVVPSPPQWDTMSCQDRTQEFLSACKSLQSRQNGLQLNKPVLSAVRQRSEFTVMAKRIGKDLSNTFAKLEKLTICEEHEFCWMLRLRCQKGEWLTKAFVLLNLEHPPDGAQPPPYRLLLTTPPSLRQHLQPRHRSRATKLLSEEACGVRYDVTEPFRSAGGGRDAQMCVKAICPEEDVCGALRLGLHCPPFLATLWRSLPRPDD